MYNLLPEEPWMLLNLLLDNPHFNNVNSVHETVCCDKLVMFEDSY